MEVFMEKEIHLYVKTHNKTGIKYFGKTINDPFKYNGSGVAWRKHLRENGNDVTTIIIASFLDKNKCKEYARKFSKDNDIQNSSAWANLIPETLGGWGHGYCTIAEKMKIDPQFKEEMSKKYSNAAKGHTRQCGAKNSSWGKICITDGKNNKKIEKHSVIPEGWRRGFTIKYKKPENNPSWFKKKI